MQFLLFFRYTLVSQDSIYLKIANALYASMDAPLCDLTIDQLTTTDLKNYQNNKKGEAPNPPAAP